MSDKNVITMGSFQGGMHSSRSVSVEVDKCQQAMAQLKEANIPLYDVDSLERNETELRTQARKLRQQADELEKQADERRALALMCGRRDRELAAKGMILAAGRIRMIDGDNL